MKEARVPRARRVTCPPPLAPVLLSHGHVYSDDEVCNAVSIDSFAFVIMFMIQPWYLVIWTCEDLLYVSIVVELLLLYWWLVCTYDVIDMLIALYTHVQSSESSLRGIRIILFFPCGTSCTVRGGIHHSFFLKMFKIWVSKKHLICQSDVFVGWWRLCLVFVSLNYSFYVLMPTNGWWS